MRVRWVLASGVVSALLGGCAAGPDYRAPAAPQAQRYTAQPLATGAQRFADDHDIAADWWTVFQSSDLNALIEQALAANADLQAADAALRAARETAAAQRSAFFPSVDAQLNSTRQVVAPVLSSPLDSGSTRYSLHTAQLDISYSPDVFGLNRRQVEAAEAEAQVQRFQREAAHLTIATNVTVTVIQLAATKAQVDATHALIDLSTRQLELFRRQQQLGQLGSADVTAQEAALAQVQATLPALEKQAAQQRNQLAVLLGRLPSEMPERAIALDALQLPSQLPLSLPSRLVAQRPDLRAAEAQLHAASAQVGVAIANRLPNLTLTASAGSSALQLSGLFGSGTGFWGAGATLLQPVFDGGALAHRQRAAQAAYEQAAAQYRGAVLSAFQNVADTLEAIQADGRAHDAALVSERAAQRSLEIARRQQAVGSVGALPVLNAEQAYRQAVLTRIQADASRLSDSVALFQALGGGWWNRADQVSQSR
ncbi:MAG TPA: efflux transporter outer membrane subunit [Burkholderiaceae bacterium]|nr:efflux transporter outer membrane subunit [Burkholderiaceae bacterium]